MRALRGRKLRRTTRHRRNGSPQRRGCASWVMRAAAPASGKIAKNSLSVGADKASNPGNDDCAGMESALYSHSMVAGGLLLTS